MCGRTSLFVPQSVLEDQFDATAVEPITPRYNIAPGDELATIQNDAPDEIDLLEWGLLPSWVDDPSDSPKPINARAETVAEKPMFRDAFDEWRCLVLADGFYEWKQTPTGKQPYRIERADRDPFAFAGLWESAENAAGNGSDATFTIVTTEPNAVVEPVHHRMPVMLSPGEEARWLRAGDADLLDPYPTDEMRAYPVSTAVNDPANDSPAVVEEVPAEEDVQTGLDEF